MKPNVKKEKLYGALAIKYVRANRQELLPTIKPNTPEWEIWQRYFVDHLGFMPFAMHRIIQTKTPTGQFTGEFTVPADTPQQFDPTYGKALAANSSLRLVSRFPDPKPEPT